MSSTELKFEVPRDHFADAVAWAAKSLPTKALAPVMSGVLLRGDDKGLNISGFDYEVSCEALTAADITSQGSVLRVSESAVSDCASVA